MRRLIKEPEKRKEILIDVAKTFAKFMGENLLKIGLPQVAMFLEAIPDIVKD